MKDYQKEVEAYELKILQLEESIQKSKDKIKILKQKIRSVKAKQQKDERQKILKIIDEKNITTASEFEALLDAAMTQKNIDRQDDDNFF